MPNDDLIPNSYTPEPREGSVLGTYINDDLSETYVLFGGKSQEQVFQDTWEITFPVNLDTPVWLQTNSDQSNIPNIFNAQMQTLKINDDNRLFLTGGLDESQEGDLPTFQRNFNTQNWDKKTNEDRSGIPDQTPDVIDYVGLAKIKDTKLQGPDTSILVGLAWQNGIGQPVIYYNQTSNQWRTAVRQGNILPITCYGSYIWTELPDADNGCRMYILGGYDKDGNPQKLFQRINLRYTSNQTRPLNAELLQYSDVTKLADENSPLFTLDMSTPLFEGDPLVADGIANIRIANQANLRINTPVNDFTKNSCTPLFPLKDGTFDDNLGWLDRDQLETHVLIPFSSFAEIRLIELYIIKATGEIKVRVPLEDFDPHPVLPQVRNNPSFTGYGIDELNRVDGLLMFGGSYQDNLYNDLWRIQPINQGTSNYRFVWNRLT